MQYVVTTDNSIASANIMHVLETVKSVVKVFALPASMPKVKAASVFSAEAVSDAQAMAFIESLAVKDGHKVPADERGIEARIDKY